MNNIITIVDKNSYNEVVMWAIVTWKPVPSNNDSIIVDEVIYANSYPGEIKPVHGTYWPKRHVREESKHRMMKGLFVYTFTR